jgi:hypothetical protein
VFGIKVVAASTLVMVIVLGACSTQTTEKTDPPISDEPGEVISLDVVGDDTTETRLVVVDIDAYLQSVASAGQLPLVLATLKFPEGVATFEGRSRTVALAMPRCSTPDVLLTVTFPIVAGGERVSSAALDSLVNSEGCETLSVSVGSNLELSAR